MYHDNMLYIKKVLQMYNQYLPTLSSSNNHSIQKPLSNMYLFKQFRIILTLFMVTTIQANPMQQMALSKESTGFTLGGEWYKSKAIGESGIYLTVEVIKFQN